MANDHNGFLGKSAAAERREHLAQQQARERAAEAAQASVNADERRFQEEQGRLSRAR